jgi:excisionase family DNA binding protein
MPSTNNRDNPRLAYRVEEFGAAAGVGRSTVYEEISAGRLKAVKCGSRTLIPADAAEAWLK